MRKGLGVAIAFGNLPLQGQARPQAGGTPPETPATAIAVHGLEPRPAVLVAPVAVDVLDRIELLFEGHRVRLCYFTSVRHSEHAFSK
jgi:hypothetical protein